MIYFEHITLSNFVYEFWKLFCLMSPAMLLGFLIAGIISAFLKVSFIERHFGQNRLWDIIKASLFGVPLPLCSCSVLPVGLALRKHGASRGAVTSFLISTPQTGVDSVIVTGSIIGLVFAVFKVISAFITGIVGGVITQWLIKFGFTSEHAEDNEIKSCCSHKETSESECHQQPEIENSTDINTDNFFSILWQKAKHALHYGYVVLIKDISKPFLFGVLIATAITLFVPDKALIKVSESDHGYALTMLLMLIIGVPMYVCSTASVPIAASLMLKGISPGAAFVFLMTGPATNLATLVTLWKILGKKNTMIYLFTIMTSSIGFGLILDLIYKSYIPSQETALHTSTIHMPEQIAGVGMLFLVISATLIPFLKKLYRKIANKEEPPKKEVEDKNNDDEGGCCSSGGCCH